MSQSRQLAAIMFTDIVGYTALMGNDEKKAFVLLDKNRKLQRPVIEAFNGRWIKELGDGVMASFPTVSDAVNAAIKIQENCNAANDFQLRIGLHQGEVIFKDDDVFGDAVNIAARIQAAASPGCIFISETVHHNVSNKKEIETRFVKEEILNNVSQPVRMYQVLFAGSEIIVAEKAVIPIALNSIAVLPFVNMSSDPEQEYFSDGISEDIINDLAQVPGLKVIGRTSSFAFKGKNLDLKWIGEQLKVTHLLEGSVRKSGNKLRITAQLIHVADGFHLYSEKFDRELEDIFAIQDELSLAILNAIKIKLLGVDKEALLKKYTENIEAYQLYLKARFYYNKYTPDATLKAIEYLKEAIKIDPEYAIAYSSLSFCYMTLWYWNWLPAGKSLPQSFVATAQQSLRMDDEIAESHLAVGRVLLHYEKKIVEAAVEYKKSLAINPNSAECHVQLGFCAVLLGQYAEANKHATIADSLDPFSLMNLYFISYIYWCADDHEKALSYGNRLVDMEPHFFGGHLALGLVYMATGRFDEAMAKLELSATMNPDMLTLNSLAAAYGVLGEKIKAKAIIEKMEEIEGIQIAGNNFLGMAHASIGELDTAFTYFEKAMDGREGNMIWVKISLRHNVEFMKDPRARRLFEQLGVA
jgi:serine/threonine-protein kinase